MHTARSECTVVNVAPTRDQAYSPVGQPAPYSSMISRHFHSSAPDTVVLTQHRMAGTFGGNHKIYSSLVYRYCAFFTLKLHELQNRSSCFLRIYFHIPSVLFLPAGRANSRMGPCSSIAKALAQQQLHQQQQQQQQQQHAKRPILQALVNTCNPSDLQT